MKAVIFAGICILILPIVKSTQPTASDEKQEEILTPEATNLGLISLNITDRHRRLIPYITYYDNPIMVAPKMAPQSNYGKIFIVYRPRDSDLTEDDLLPRKFTPFSNTNKLPGGFTPIRRPPKLRLQIVDIPQQAPVQAHPEIQNIEHISHEVPNHIRHHIQPQNVQVPIQTHSEIENIPPVPQEVPQHIRHQVQPQTILVNKEPSYSKIYDKLLQLKQQQYSITPQYQSPKVVTQYYTRNYATPRPPTQYVQNYQKTQPAKTYIHTYTPSNIDIPNENKVQNYDNFEPMKTYNQIPAPTSATPYNQPIIVPVKSYQVEQEQEYQSQQQQIPQEEKIYQPVLLRPVYRPIPVKNYRPIYQTEPTTSVQTTQNPHSLSVILKQLQDSNTLPHTLTPDNIDNSIKTLVQILNALKHTEKFQKPIVVAQVEDVAKSQDNLDDYDDSILPETVSQSYPANTPEGGTPGKPGVDYPAYSFIPQTNFNCKKQRYKGFFGDPDTNCQVWHYCDLNGGQASFLCPNGTIFSQVALTCDWWFNVKCATTTQLYVLNERLYKYILPFTPKFPEDYSGPLVDRYLALKFKEMEEKMKKQKKGKTEKPVDDTQNAEINKLQDVQSESESFAETQEHTTKTAPPVSDNK